MLVGVRDFNGPDVPAARRRANRFSNLWFRISSGVYLGDTQCGFRCYPLEDTLRINARAERYGYELEIMVRAAWLDIPLIPVPVGVVYSEATARGSHFRPVVDFLRLTRLNARLLALAFFVPRPLRAIMSKGMLKGLSFREKLGTVGRELFCEHMESPGRFAAAIASGMEPTMNPVRPSSTTSGTEPPRNAITGVPHAKASIITRPNGSGQSIGNSSAVASPRNASLSCSPISPRYSTSGWASIGLIFSSK